MTREMEYLILLAFSPLLMFLVHMGTGRIYVRLNLHSSLLISAVWAVLISFVTVAFFAWKLFLNPMENRTEQAVAILYGILVSVFLGGSYYILFAMTEAARRIKILQEIYHKGGMTLDEMNRIYGPGPLLSVRLERLVALNQLEKKNDRYYLKGKALYGVAVLVSFWSKLLNFSKGKNEAV